MVSRLSIAALVCVVGVALARPQANEARPGPNGPGANGRHHGHGGRHGPLGAIYNKLSDSQKEQLQAIFKDQTLTKGQIKTKLGAFEQSLPSDLQVEITKGKQEHDAKKTEFAAAVSNLSANAQTVANQIKAIKDNENITPEQEQEQIKAVLDGVTDASVKQELEKAHLLHGGRHGEGSSAESNNVQ